MLQVSLPPAWLPHCTGRSRKEFCQKNRPVPVFIFWILCVFLQPEVLQWAHASKRTCHQGIKRTQDVHLQLFWWTALDEDTHILSSLSRLLSIQIFFPLRVKSQSLASTFVVLFAIDKIVSLVAVSWTETAQFQGRPPNLPRNEGILWSFLFAWISAVSSSLWEMFCLK